MTSEGPPVVGAAGRSPSGLALVADSVRGIGMMASATYIQQQTSFLAADKFPNLADKLYRLRRHSWVAAGKAIYTQQQRSSDLLWL